MTEEIVKIAVLEQKLIDFGNNISKLDDAIIRLSEVSADIRNMLAAHDEKIIQTERNDELILRMYGEMKENNEREHERSRDKISKLEERISEVSKVKWMVVGIGTVVAVLVAAGTQLMGGIVTPSEIQQYHHSTQKP